MAFRPKAVLASLVGIVACAAMVLGCAKEEPSLKAAPANDPLRDALASVPMSPGLKLGKMIEDCTPYEASGILDEEFEPSTRNAEQIWETCQMLYACSPTAKKIMQELFDKPGASFNLAFSDLKSLHVPHLSDKIGGLYLAGTSNVYVDATAKTPRDACHVLLHEVVHRFDSNAEAGEESLRTEYRAYWYQTAFLEELYLDDGILGAAMKWGRNVSGEAPGRQLSLHTRRSLIAKIAEYYGFPADFSILENFPPLPFEKTGRVIVKVATPANSVPAKP